ncbi:MAG: sulfatase-like hydrolase/transferase [Phycisphaera sp.]|nr:sulfatase-like hydrolase/transferase [Phycisphaera sp.]
MMVAAPRVSTVAAPPSRPNIVVIMADDLGYSDIGCYGAEIHTPNLDRLAQQGLRFKQFYNCGKCEATRAALLTGLPIQCVNHSPALPYAAPTFAELARQGGYRTLMVGKWHAGELPFNRGFDRYYGLTDGCCNFFNPGGEARPGEPKPAYKIKVRRWAIDDKPVHPYVPKDPDYYTTDAFTDYAIDYLRTYRDEDRPFLLYVAYTAPHFPLQARPRDIDRYRDTYKVGWDVIRQQRHKRLIELGLLSADTVCAPRNTGVPAWDALTDEQRRFEANRMAVYAAMVDSMDQNIGRLLRSLDDLGKLDNTLILFFSDNGAGDGEFDYSTTKGADAGPIDSYRPIGAGWAGVSNFPFRGTKGDQWEGGLESPCVACWPGVIKPGSITGQRGHVMDVLATCIDLAGVDYPPQFQGKPLPKLIGRSLVPIFKGEPRPEPPTWFGFLRGSASVRDGQWKAIRAGNHGWMLFDLDTDPTEQHDVASKHPERINRMAQDYAAWVAETVETQRDRLPYSDNSYKRWRSEVEYATGIELP